VLISLWHFRLGCNFVASSVTCAEHWTLSQYTTFWLFHLSAGTWARPIPDD